MSSVEKLFDYILCVRLAHTPGTNPSAVVEYRYPPHNHNGRTSGDQSTNKFLDSITEFCFPDSHAGLVKLAPEGEWFSFVLTSDDGARRFGYCFRCQPSLQTNDVSSPSPDATLSSLSLPPPSSALPAAAPTSTSGSSSAFSLLHTPSQPEELRNPACFCLLSFTPCYTVFTEILKRVASMYSYFATENSSLTAFLDGFKLIEMPEPGSSIVVPVPNSSSTIEIKRPDGNDSHLEYLNFQPLIQKLSADHLFRIVIAMLAERRVIFVSSSLAILSSCTQAAVALLYPFQWQHIFIPVLPPSLLYFCCAPMPFVVGVLSSFLPALSDLYESMEDVFIVDLDSDRFLRKSENDAVSLPKDLTDPVIAILKSLQKKILFFRLKNYDGPVGELPPLEKRTRLLEAFLTFFVEILSNYRSFIMSSHEDGFDKAAFIAAAPPAYRDFLQTLTGTQLFERFITERARKQLVQQQSPFDKRVTLYNSIAALCHDMPDAPSRFSRFELGLTAAAALNEQRKAALLQDIKKSALPVSTSIPALSSSAPSSFSPIVPPPLPALPPPAPPAPPLVSILGKSPGSPPAKPTRTHTLLGGVAPFSLAAQQSPVRDRSATMEPFSRPPALSNETRRIILGTVSIPKLPSEQQQQQVITQQQTVGKPLPNNDDFFNTESPSLDDTAYPSSDSPCRAAGAAAITVPTPTTKSEFTPVATPPLVRSVSIATIPIPPPPPSPPPPPIVRLPSRQFAVKPARPGRQQMTQSQLQQSSSLPTFQTSSPTTTTRTTTTLTESPSPLITRTGSQLNLTGNLRPLPPVPTQPSGRPTPRPLPRSTSRRLDDLSAVRHSSGPPSLQSGSVTTLPTLADYIKWLRIHNQTEFIPRIEALQPEFDQLHFSVSQLNPIAFFSLFDLPAHHKTLRLFTLTQEFVFSHAKPIAPPRSSSLFTRTDDAPAEIKTPPRSALRENSSGAHLSALPQKQIVGMNIAAFERVSVGLR